VALAQKLGIIEVRYLRIIDGFLEKKADVVEYINNSLLSLGAKQQYHDNFMERIRRF
jgi:hypothetical protein